MNRLDHYCRVALPNTKLPAVVSFFSLRCPVLRQAMIRRYPGPEAHDDQQPDQRESGIDAPPARDREKDVLQAERTRGHQHDRGEPFDEIVDRIERLADRQDDADAARLQRALADPGFGARGPGSGVRVGLWLTA